MNNLTPLKFLEWRHDWAFSREKWVAQILGLLSLGIEVLPHFQRMYLLPLLGIWFGSPIFQRITNNSKYLRIMLIDGA